MRVIHSHPIFRFAVMALIMAHSARAQNPNPSPDPLTQLMISQPHVDISAPIMATAAFDPPVVKTNEKAVYRVTFNRASDATAVSVRWPSPLPAPAPLRLRLAASGQNLEVAGGVMQTFSTFNFEARASAAGTFTVPEFTVEVFGKSVTVPAAILVVQTELTEPHEPARELFLESSETNLFVGEPLDVRILLPSTPGYGVEGVSQIELSGDGFLVQKYPNRQAIEMIERDGLKRPTYVYETTATPIAAGRLTLSVQGFTSGMRFNGPVVISGPVTLSSAPPQYVLLGSEMLNFNVRPLPVENELPGFAGAVGQYTCDPPRLSTNTVRLGEPVRLTVTIHGGRTLNKLIPPSAPRTEGWQSFPPVRGGIVVEPGSTNPGAVFDYTMIPTVPDVKATPAIAFCCFDPVAGKYRDLTIPPVPITIITNDVIASAEPPAATGNARDSEPVQTLSRLAPAPGRTANSFVPSQMRGWFPVVQLLPVFGFAGLWFWDRRKRYLERHPEIVRRRRARRALHRELRVLDRTASAGDASNYTCCAVRCLQIVTAPAYPAHPRAMVCRDVLDILTASEPSDQATQTVRKFFAAADVSAFAVAPVDSVDLIAEKNALKEILRRMEARL